jgi:hypothetical protein
MRVELGKSNQERGLSFLIGGHEDAAPGFSFCREAEHKLSVQVNALGAEHRTQNKRGFIFERLPEPRVGIIFFMPPVFMG